MGILGIRDMLAGMYQYAGKVPGTDVSTVGFMNLLQRTDVSTVGFMNLLQKTGEAQNISKIEIYQEYLERRYGNVMIQNVGKDQKSMDSIGVATSGTGNVVIAPNILEQMADDPQKAAYYEGKIQYYYDSLPRCQAELSLMGHEIHSSGIVIHPDGTITHYVSGDLKPEVRARIEAQIKAEDEAKAARKREYLRRSEEAAYNRRLEMNIKYSKMKEGLTPGLVI